MKTVKARQKSSLILKMNKSTKRRVQTVEKRVKSTQKKQRRFRKRFSQRPIARPRTTNSSET